MKKNDKIDVKFHVSAFKKIITYLTLNRSPAKEQYFILGTALVGLWDLIHKFVSPLYQEIHTPSMVISGMHEFSGLLMLCIGMLKRVNP